MKQPDTLKRIFEFRFPAWFAALVVFVLIVEFFDRSLLARAGKADDLTAANLRWSGISQADIGCLQRPSAALLSGSARSCGAGTLSRCRLSAAGKAGTAAREPSATARQASAAAR